MFTDWIKEYTPFFSNIGTFLKILKYVPGLAGKIRSSMSDFEEDNDLNIKTVNYCLIKLLEIDSSGCIIYMKEGKA